MPAMKRNEYNILVLGQTGVGKSTWINAIINYFQYKTLKKAKKEGVIISAETNFSVNGVSYSFKPNGSSEGGVKAGESVTQDCKTYSIKRKNIKLNIIDTPGIADTRGMEQDQFNIEQILDHIRFMNDIHAICVLLKPNETRITPQFRYCVVETLTFLHKEAKENLYFCFTNSNDTFYRLGDTKAILDSLLTELKLTNFDLMSRCLLLDNACYRYLCICQNNKTISRKKDRFIVPKEEKEKYKKCWDHSIKETKKFFDQLTMSPPHSASKMVSLNEGRKHIMNIINAIGEVTGCIAFFLTEIHKHIKMAERSKTVTELYKCMEIEHHYLTWKRTPDRYVCTNSSCAEEIFLQTIGGATYQNFKVCSMSNKLQQKPDNTCRSCSCNENFHQIINYKVTPYTFNIFDEDTQEEIKSVDDFLEQKDIVIEELTRYQNKLKEEEEKIIHCSAQFGIFLKNTSLTPFNDSLEQYMETLIKNLESTPNKNKKDTDALKRMRGMKERYKRNLEELKKLIPEDLPKENISTEEIMESIEELCHLPIYGFQLWLGKDAMEIRLKNQSIRSAQEVNINDGSESD